MAEHLRYLVKKYFEGKLSLKEDIELSEQLADKQNHAVEQILSEDWKSQLESDSTTDLNFKPILDQVHHRIRLNEDNRTLLSRWGQAFQRAAAILIIPLLLSFIAYYYYQTHQSADLVSYAEIQCPMGVRTKFSLPDGSTGYLNSGSCLRYPVQFTRERSVELSGEALFEVVHNKKSPFHVNTKNLDIKVLGTTFNVIAYEDEKSEEIILQTGKVDVSSKNGKLQTVMSPNEKLTLDTEKRTFAKEEVEASQYGSWKDGKLVFRNENMQQLARRLSRWYNAEVIVEDRMLDDYTFHATFIDEPLDEVLKLLSITTPISYHIEKRSSSQDSVFQKRKVTLKINQTKINQFR